MSGKRGVTGIDAAGAARAGLEAGSVPAPPAWAGYWTWVSAVIILMFVLYLAQKGRLGVARFLFVVCASAYRDDRRKQHANERVGPPIQSGKRNVARRVWRFSRGPDRGDKQHAIVDWATLERPNGQRRDPGHDPWVRKRNSWRWNRNKLKCACHDPRTVKSHTRPRLYRVVAKIDYGPRAVTLALILYGIATLFFFIGASAALEQLPSISRRHVILALIVFAWPALIVCAVLMLLAGVHLPKSREAVERAYQKGMLD
jgi:hypothetical protein